MYTIKCPLTRANYFKRRARFSPSHKFKKYEFFVVFSIFRLITIYHIRNFDFVPHKLGGISMLEIFKALPTHTHRRIFVIFFPVIRGRASVIPPPSIHPIIYTIVRILGSYLANCFLSVIVHTMFLYPEQPIVERKTLKPPVINDILTYIYIG